MVLPITRGKSVLSRSQLSQGLTFGAGTSRCRPVQGLASSDETGRSRNNRSGSSCGAEQSHGVPCLGARCGQGGGMSPKVAEMRA